MQRSVRLIPLLVLAVTFAGCATSRQWSESHSERELGLVRVSYEFPEYREPQLSDAQAVKLAVSRCNGWGFDDAEPVAGQLRQCSSMNDGNCNVWKVTREFQCTRDVAFADVLAR